MWSLQGGNLLWVVTMNDQLFSIIFRIKREFYSWLWTIRSDFCTPIWCSNDLNWTLILTDFDIDDMQLSKATLETFESFVAAE